MKELHFHQKKFSEKENLSEYTLVSGLGGSKTWFSLVRNLIPFNTFDEVKEHPLITWMKGEISL